jgi:hypothetical protein
MLTMANSGVKKEGLDLKLQEKFTLPYYSSLYRVQVQGSLIWDSRLLSLFVSDGTQWLNVFTVNSDGVPTVIPSVIIIQESPSSPFDPTGENRGVIYVRDDGVLIFVDDSGTEHELTGVGSVETLAETLISGNETGGTDIDLTDGSRIISPVGDNIILDPQGDNVVVEGDLIVNGDLTVNGDINLPAGSIGTDDIANGAITSDKLDANAVTLAGTGTGVTLVNDGTISTGFLTKDLIAGTNVSFDISPTDITVNVSGLVSSTFMFWGETPGGQLLPSGAGDDYSGGGVVPIRVIDYNDVIINQFPGNYDPTTFRYTIPTSGLYFVSASIRLEPGAGYTQYVDTISMRLVRFTGGDLGEQLELAPKIVVTANPAPPGQQDILQFTNAVILNIGDEIYIRSIIQSTALDFTVINVPPDEQPGSFKISLLSAS